MKAVGIGSSIAEKFDTLQTTRMRKPLALAARRVSVIAPENKQKKADLACNEL